MTFISYAQNFEDVLLWRALGHVRDGFYVDVGAWSPTLDSVTKAFYDRGWHGISIEPNPEFHRQLQGARPRDINLCLAVSDSAGTGTLNIVSNPGLSTLDNNIAETHSKAGYVIDRMSVELETLSQVWARFVPENQEVHFLKVDVEGLEGRVIRGNDWERNRPWVVVVEATYPSSQEETYATWEPLLTHYDYRAAYADGLNRFYVAREHDDLMHALRYPPNYFDGFKQYAVVELEEQLAQAKVHSQQAERRVQKLVEKVNEVRAERNDIESRCDALQWELSKTAKRENRLQRETDQLVDERRDSAEWQTSDAKARAGKVHHVAIFTIVSNNYLHFARTLMESIRANEPECDRYVMVLDQPVAKQTDGDAGLYTAISIDRLNLPEPLKFLFRYNVLEANTAVKPWVMEYLAGDLGYDSVIYLDPDIYVYRPLLEVKTLIEKGATLVLTPHLTGPIEDDKRPSETDILRAGTYNLGFAAIGKWESAKPLLRWWQERLERGCVVDLDNGLFVDQKWMNQAPGLFENVATLRHKGYNVAYWNLHERPVRQQHGDWFAGNSPLHFFHFSGLNVDNPHEFSRHQTRFTLDDIGDAKELVLEYCIQLKNNGAGDFQGISYGFAQHASGYPIPDTVRRLYRNNTDVEEAWGDDPFSIDLTPVLNAFGDDEFQRPRLTRLMRWVWRDQLDIQGTFPNPEAGDRIRYVDWFVKNGEQQLGLPDCWIEPAREELGALGGQEVREAIPTKVGEVVDLFALHGEAFVRKAYQLVLRRAADPDGLRNFADRLDRRELTKRRVVWALVWSDEARRRGGRLSELILLFLPVPLLKPFSRWSRYARARNEPGSPPQKESFALQVRSRSIKIDRGYDDSADMDHAIRVVGYFDMATGVGESARRCVAAAEAADICVEKWRVGLDQQFDRQQPALGSSGNTVGDPSFTIAHINADQLCVMGDKLDFVDEGSSYRIGYWHWELPEFPKKYFRAFKFVDEIWVPSDHMLFTLSKVSPVPVVKIPHSVELPFQTNSKRNDFEIPNEAFVYLCMYDMGSYQERKNPMGAVRAYLMAFPQSSTRQHLVIKVSNPEFDHQSLNVLIEAIQGREDILLRNQNMSREEVYQLENSIDCFVSLHRAEGFGLCAAECMYLGKSVIATGWSGNMEFMNEENSYLVDYRLTEITTRIGPYEAGQLWAEPDISHAASLMREAFHDAQGRRKKSEKATRTIKTNLSSRAVGRQYKSRLGNIAQLALNRSG